MIFSCKNGAYLIVHCVGIENRELGDKRIEKCVMKFFFMCTYI